MVNRLSFVATKIVYDNDFAGGKSLNQQLAHIGSEPFLLDRPVEQEGCVYAAVV